MGRLCTCSHSPHQSPRLQATALSAQELLSQKELVAHALALFCLGKTSAFSAQLSRCRCHSGACVQFNSPLALVCVRTGPPAPGKPPRIATWTTKTSTHSPLNCSPHCGLSQSCHRDKVIFPGKDPQSPHQGSETVYLPAVQCS